MRPELKQILAKGLLAAMLTATLLPYQTFAATETAINLSQRYVVEQATEVSDTKILFNNQEQSFQNPVININGRVYLPVRDLANTLGCEIEWDNEAKVATVTPPNGKVIEVPIGSNKIVVDGNPVQIDQQGTKALIYQSRTYLPIRIICEYAGHTVDYQTSGNTKYVLIDSHIPDPSKHTYDDEITVPEQYKGTKYLKMYNSLRRAFGLTEEQAKIVMASIKSFAPDTDNDIEFYRYSDEVLSTPECIAIEKNVPDPTLKGEWYLQPHPTNAGWYWNGNNWAFNAGFYFGMDQ